ncbi:MAG: RluA family pseudouridine synthase [Lachnospiraceae bacterium]|nr:RluA family pseudouridine synthase [Lachnospiraceae bacterium]
MADLVKKDIIEEKASENKTVCFEASITDDDERIDKVVTNWFQDLSRSYIQKMIKDGNVFVNEKIVKANYRVKEGDVIRCTIPACVEPEILAEDMPLDILYEDEDILVVNKPKGMVVHPSAGHYSGTLVNGLLFHCKGQLSGINGVFRPGIVHRIDKDTTGSLIVCKSESAHKAIAEQLKEHSVTRKYRAIVYGNFEQEEGTIDAPIGRDIHDRKKMAVNEKNGKSAVTHYRVLEQFKGYSYIECQLETGRTHQIRVHMTSIGHPLLGDEVYGNRMSKFKLQGQCLHAMIIGFVHPLKKQYMEFTAPLPEYFTHLLQIL